MNEADGQLWAAHLILGSFAFQAPKCVIRARNLRLHRISVAYEGFIVPEGIPLPQYTSRTEPLFVASVLTGTSSSLPTLREKEIKGRKEEKKDEEEVVAVSEFSDDFEIFDQLISPGEDPDKMGYKENPREACWG